MRPTTLLFLCVRNSARSQIAEGMARKLFGSKIEARSAGSEPSFVHPLTARVLREKDVDAGLQRSKPMAKVTKHDVDYVITLCDEEVCPTEPLPVGVKRLHWPVPDPIAAVEGEDYGKQLERFRAAREEIEDKLRRFGEEQKLF